MKSEHTLNFSEKPMKRHPMKVVSWTIQVLSKIVGQVVNTTLRNHDSNDHQFGWMLRESTPLYTPSHGVHTLTVTHILKP